MSRATQRPIYTLDCETDPFKKGRVPEPFLWGVYGESTYREFATGQEVAEFLSGLDAIVYAHNGGRFDYHYLRPYINCDEPLMVINGRMSKFKIGLCECRDSINVLPVPLSAFHKDKIDYALMEATMRDQPAVREKIREYLRSDCINLHTFVTEFIARYGSNLTQAGAAMKYWSKNFNRDIPSQSRFSFQQFKPYYYGGRVQCFVQGVRSVPFTVVDINSAYPYAMGFRHPYTADSITRLGMPKDEKLGPTLCKVRAISRGALPLRGDDGSLWFPHDERHVREYNVTGWEIAAGLETDTLKIIKVLSCETFPQTVDFKDYVSHFYAERQKAKAAGDKAGDIFAKIFLNSLYGKFAASPDKYSEQVLSSPERTASWAEQGFEVGADWGRGIYMSRPLPPQKHRYYNVATAASITGFVRAHLWKSAQKCGGLIYCDTDSIAAEDVSGLEQGKELGQWKIEAECDRYAVAGKKTYAFRKMPAFYESEMQAHLARLVHAQNDEKPELWKIASKGVDLSAEDIEKIANGETVDYSPEVPTYSVHRIAPVFVGRTIKKTYRDISNVSTIPV